MVNKMTLPIAEILERPMPKQVMAILPHLKQWNLHPIGLSFTSQTELFLTL
jgi:hypothetical protein